MRQQATHINHESSRKAFETVVGKADLSTPTGSDINHESSRKAFETTASTSITGSPALHINHESSRKAFETPKSPPTRLPKSARNINHESSRKAFETLGHGNVAGNSDLNINHESSRKAFETQPRRRPQAREPFRYQSRI